MEPLSDRSAWRPDSQLGKWVAATDYLDAMDLDGVIALQVHGGHDVDVWFKDIEILDDAK